MLAMVAALGASAESVTATWELSNPDNLAATEVSVSQASAAWLSTGFTLGSKIADTRAIGSCSADEGYDGATFTPAFTGFKPATKVTAKTDGHCIMFTVTPASGHSFLPRSIAFDAMKVGTDGGSVDVYYKIGSGAETAITTGLSPLRNKITASNSTGYSHHEFQLADVLADGQPFTLCLYIMNLNGADTSSAKEMAFRNVTIKGGLDEKETTVGDHLSAFGCTGSLALGKEQKIDLLPLVRNLKNGETAAYPSKLFGDPKDFTFTEKEGYSAAVSYEGHTVRVAISRGADAVLDFGVRFTVTNRQPKPAAKPLNRGLMSLSLTGARMGTGNLVSWRHREADGHGVKYKLYRGDASAQTEALNDDRYITDRTNFLDAEGTADNYYLLETYNAYGRLLSTEVSRKTWGDQTFRIPLETPPTDSKNGGTYTPNDASYCDMDGDGEYEIILKWSPSNEKDAASSGATSPAVFDCLKLDGTRLWRINAGPNFFTSAHTIQFIAWDFDGDGYGEFMMKTAPGTIDGEGNYVLLGNDDPYENLLSGRGKQDHGSEYITVFDGLTGGELATIPYHTAYNDVTTAIWGDTNQNRSERYLAGLAYLDGPDANPSPIFARGYYKGAFVAAYDWDGTALKQRWVSRNTTSGKGLWGEGAHWMACGDCDGDGRHEIVYGSAALDHDGSLLYRTGLGHGDALHLGDFLPDRPGLEVFMVHEESPYGYDLRDAKTGKFILHETAGSDTGRGLAAHFDSYYDRSQFIYSASGGVFDCLDGSMIDDEWKIGGSGAGINNRIYWDGDLYDEFYDKSILAHWNHENGWFDRYKVNNGNYTIGTLNNSSKYNPCVLGDLLGDWREEIVLWGEDADGNRSLIINATSYETEYRIPHLMDDLNYRVQVVNQNCCYNQPPHLSIDPSRVYAANPNRAQQEDLIGEEPGGPTVTVAVPAAEEADVIYTATGLRIREITAPGLYIVNGKKLIVR